MSNKAVNRRQRLVRVRQAQHAMAVAETIRAQDQVNSLANNAQRLAQVRSELFQPSVAQLGSTLGANRELADRLERAGKQLEGAIYDARKVVTHKQDLQMGTNRDKEIALRLKYRARAEAEQQQEARIAAIPRYRSMQQRGQE